MMKSFRYIFPWSLFVLGIVLVVKDQLVPPFIMISFISSTAYWKKIKFNSSFLPLFGLIILFLVYLIGMSYSENLKFGWRDIESRLSFVIFPLMLILSSRSLNLSIIQKAKDGIIIGVLISLLISFLRAIYCKINGGEICFRADQFGFNMHATYLSVMYTMAILFVFERKINVRFELLWKIAFFLVALIAMYFMRSLSSFVALAVISVFAFFYFVFKYKKWIFLALIPIFIFGGVFMLKRLPQLSWDINNTIDTVKDYKKDPDNFIERKKNWVESNTVRIVVWDFSVDIIRENPFGVGTGDVKDKLFETYNLHGYDEFTEKGLNSHCQFLQTGIAIGWIGIILLFLIIVFPFFSRFTRNDFVYCSFLLLIFLTCLFESYLERQAGIIFFSFISSVLIVNQVLVKNTLKIKES